MIKKIARSLREYKLPAILTPVFVIGESILEVIIPLVLASLIDKGIEMGDMAHILKMGALLLVLAALSMTSGILAGKTATKASAGFAKNLRHDMYYHIQEFSFINIDKFSTSSLITRLTTDVQDVANTFQMLIRMAMRSPALLVSASVAAFTIDKKLPLIFFAFIPFLVAGLAYITITVHPTFQKVFKTYDVLNQAVEENIRGMRVVKTFTREEYEKEKFGKVSKSIFDNFTKAEKMIAFNSPIMQFSMYMSTLLVCWFGAKSIVASGNVVGNGLTTGQLMSLLSYAGQILMGFMTFSFIFVMISMSRARCERIVEVLDEKSDMTEIDKPVKEVKDGSISFTDVSFAYSRNADKLCLDNVNLEIKSGETIGIIGGTGSSKSTLVQLIPRLYDVSGGSVKVGGTDVKNYELVTLRDAVSMVLQKNVLFSGTIKENLRWGNENAADEEIKKACEQACAAEFIEGFPEKYDTFIEQGGSNVSGGQKQRLCIARALLKKPKILILDDSTSAVDTKTDAIIRQAMRDTIPDTTKIIIAQRIASVMDADRIIVMDDGKISAFGTHEELLESSGIYREVFESQLKGGTDDGQN